MGHTSQPRRRNRPQAGFAGLVAATALWLLVLNDFVVRAASGSGAGGGAITDPNQITRAIQWLQGQGPIGALVGAVLLTLPLLGWVLSQAGNLEKVAGWFGKVAGWFGLGLKQPQASGAEPETSALRGKWVDAAYLLPRDGGPGVIYFGSIVSIEFDKGQGAMICTGRNYSYEQTRLGWYKANSSQIGDLKMFYTFEWQPVDGSELILGCGRLMLTGPPLNSGKAIGLQYLTYGGTFISDRLPNFTYEGRKILPEEEDQEQAGELVANWIKELSDQRKYRIATKEELNNLFM